MTTYVFKEIKASERIKTPCVECGKSVTRTVTEFQTVNPYNLNAKGAPKTEGEIRLELPLQLKKAVYEQVKRATCKAHGGR